MDALCFHTGRLGDIEGDVAAIARSVQRVGNGTDAVSSFVTGLQKRVEDTRLVVGQKGNEIRKAEEEQRLAELKDEEEKRKTDEAARKKEGREGEKRKAEAVMRVSFSGKELEIRP